MSRHQLAAWTLITVGVGALTYSVAHAQKASDTPTLTAADYVEIQMLVARYGFALDTGTDDGYMYADLFAPGGTFIKTTGRDELAKLARGGRRGPMNVRNMSSLAIIEPSPEGATGIQYAEAINFGERDKKTPTEMDHFLWYEDVYVKTPDGWRFKTRVFYASEGGPAPKQLQNDPLKAPVAPTAAPGDPAPPPVPRATGLRNLTAEDYIEIQQLVFTYPYALDTAANNGFNYADMFAPDGEFIRPPTKGRDNLAKLAIDQPHGANYVRHYLSNIVIEPTADGAIGKQYLVVLDIGAAGTPGTIFLGGHYEDVYSKTDAGWKFKRREFIPSRKAAAASAAVQ